MLFFFLRNTSVAAQSDSFNLALLQGACSPETRLGLLANWDDLTREICTGERVWLALSAVLEGNQTFTCSLSSVSALKITCGHHRVMKVLLEKSAHLLHVLSEISVHIRIWHELLLKLKIF